jgi:hypothetical protein
MPTAVFLFIWMSPPQEEVTTVNQFPHPQVTESGILPAESSFTAILSSGGLFSRDH